MHKQILKYGILVGVVIAVTAFIFGNSFVGYAESHNTSDSVSEIILPGKNVENYEKTGFAVRKAAHLVEFTMLGIAVTLLIKGISGDCGKNVWGFGFFYVLAIAVMDEHIQSFAGRTSSTADIMLDFCGGLIGFFVGLAALRAYTVAKDRSSKKRAEMTNSNGGRE